MNKGLSENLKQSFPALIAYERPLVDYADSKFNLSNITLNPFWLSGFFNAEGCFECRIKKSKFVKIGYQVELRITLVQHSRDTLLFNIIRDFWKCGNLVKDNKKSVIYFSTTKFSDIFNIIIPFFDLYQIQGIKNLDYLDFKKIALLIENQAHLTEIGLKSIRELKSKMNNNRKFL